MSPFLKFSGASMKLTVMKLTECVGNSHALIVHQYSSSSARCACGSTLKLLSDGRWVHPDFRITCPPYECECGQRH